MTLARLHAAARGRLARVRGRDGCNDRGFALIFVLMVTMIISAGVVSMIAIAASNIAPAAQSENDQASLDAAQAGLQSYLAYLNTACVPTSNSTCSITSEPKHGTVPGADGKGTEQFTITVLNPSSYTTFLRVQSTGQTLGPDKKPNASRTLVADLAVGSPTDTMDNNLVTYYETQAPDVAAAQDFPKRTIALSSGSTSPTASADLLPSGTTRVQWNGPAPAAVATCNSLYYGSDGRVHNTVPGTSSSYIDWQESSSTPGVQPEDQPCQVSWGTGAKLSGTGGGFATSDAILLSNSYPGGTGPTFGVPISTAYQYAAVADGPCGAAGQNYRVFDLTPACGSAAAVNVGGPTPASLGASAPAYDANVPTPVTTVPTIPASSTTACVYNGPTRLLLKGSSGTVTSPQTTSMWVNAHRGYPTQCYTGASTQGMAAQTVSLTGIQRIYTQNDGAPSAGSSTPTSTGWATTSQRAGDTPSTGGAAQPANTVFYESGSAGASSPDPASASAPSTCSTTSTYSAQPFARCAWSNLATTADGGSGWATLSSRTCDQLKAATASAVASDEQTFNCEMNSNQASGGPPSNAYQTIISRVQSDLNDNSISLSGNGVCASGNFNPTTATPTQLACLIQHELHNGNSGAKEANYSTPTTGDHQYIVAAGQQGNATTGSAQQFGPTATAPASGDPLFENVPGTKGQETPTGTATTSNVGRQVYGCYLPDSSGLSGTLQKILSALGLATAPGSYDASGKSCQAQVCTLLVLCAPGPGVHTWGDGGATTDSINKSVPQFQVTATQTSKWTVTKQPSAGVSYFPSSFDSTPQLDDVTQYAVGADGTFGTSGPGDLYVEGTSTNPVALIAQNDAIITGSLGSAITGAVEVIGQDNVRVYHPVSCVDTNATDIGVTAAGFCPNDITGLYSKLLPSGARPDQQYQNLRQDLAGLSINAAIFAEGNAPNSGDCPAVTGSLNNYSGCGGQFGVDNYNRGDTTDVADFGTLTVTGTISEVHHGPAGEEWEVADATRASSRPYSGYHLTITFQSLKAALQSVSPFSTQQTASPWTIISVSSGGGPAGGGT